MDLLGAHESIAGGVQLSFDRINHVGGNSLQIFTANQKMWKPKVFRPDEVDAFKSARLAAGNMPVASHASYLVNLATQKPDSAERSIELLAGELRRCLQLGVEFVVLHPGSHGSASIEDGLTAVSKNLAAVLERSGALESTTRILLETTAGQGTALGRSFDELGWLLQNSKYPAHLGVCVDTCHIFAAGYDFRTPETYQQTMQKLQETIGFNNVRFFHINDSKKGCGSNVDRHEHIGDGEIGLEGFRLLLNDPNFQSCPMTIETPKDVDLLQDIENLRRLRELVVPAKSLDNKPIVKTRQI